MQVHRNSSYVHIMPRSFLVRNYFRRKNYWINNVEDYEADQNTNKGQLSTSYTDTKVGHVGESRFSQSLDKRTWNYEEEKSYWFELSEKEGFFNLIGTDVKGAWNVKKAEELADTPHVKRTELISQEKECKAIKKVPQPSTEQLLWENLEEKLNNMLDENPEIVKKNIKQFLENNRILVKEIAIETGLNEDCIHDYMEGNETFNEDQKRDFFQWYLLKILRPPNGSDEKSFTCYKCGKIFAYESYLERHIKYVCPDNTGRTWKCSYCGKAFQYPCYLRRHIRSHTGESPYKCDKCDRAFVRSTDLQRHIRNHTGEKPYKCSECERAFARSTDLKRHMRTHTGEKPYKCWQCGKTFSQSGSLQTHLHTHNKDGSTGRKLAKGSK